VRSKFELIRGAAMNMTLPDAGSKLQTRRRFLTGLSVAMAGAPALLWAGRSSLRLLGLPQNPTPQQMLDEGPLNPPWKIVMVSAEEPGEPLIVRGTIYGADGKTSLEGARLYVYHTDSHGYYNPHHSFQEPPRLRGWMKTNAQGQYEFRTIKPAPYPGGRIPAHIHPTAGAPGYPARWIDEYWFEGDPSLKPEDIRKNSALGSFSQILKLERDANGVLVGVRDIRLA
jgi:protocatechuate 3,4-dioxygenase beta subunit